MAKRKGKVKDIIFELDAGDISSDDEDCKVVPDTIEIIDLDETVNKTNDCCILIDEEKPVETAPTEATNLLHTKENLTNVNLSNGELYIETNTDDYKANIAVSSCSSVFQSEAMITSEDNSSLDIPSNKKTPLIKIKFRDSKVAKCFKTKLRNFISDLLKENFLVDSGDETDTEIEFWDEVSVEEQVNRVEDMELENSTENLFFVDTDPINEIVDVPHYKQTENVLMNESDLSQEDETNTNKNMFRLCFNCEGEHNLRECPVPKDYAKINARRKTKKKLGRYHVEDEQKYAHLVPGRISNKLRHALGLKRDELPLHIYRMRMLGYPPGWLEDARISHSGISMFDSSGNAVLEPDAEDGEVFEIGARDKFDMKKVLDFPGFNVPPSSRYVDDHMRLGYPPMSEFDSKYIMLEALAPNAMQAYKRKKMTMFPTSNASTLENAPAADMELDDGEDVPVLFPSRPPLPDDMPPLPPEQPPPPPPPPDDPEPPEVPSDEDQTTSLGGETFIVLDDTGEEILDDDRSQSPTLTYLEEKKKKLLEELGKGLSDGTISEQRGSEINDDILNNHVNDKNEEQLNEINNEAEETSSPNEEKTLKQDTPKFGNVKSSDYGTPVLNIVSPYQKLPANENFSKNICDIINFENLPDYTGKYEKMCTLLKKVKDKVNKIHES